ncbi:NADPH-dependent curcumin reductase [bacterium HR40]|nr:NADPH-dependent curcumin reductase [bacterium HR40]
MSQTARRIVLARRPTGAPGPEHFRLEEVRLPEPGPGEVLVRTLWLSIDPYMRGRMNDAPSYTRPVGIGETMVGECVGEVLESRASGFARGELVRGMGGWQTHFVLPAKELAKVDPELAPPSAWLGVLGMPGLTAWAALFEVAKPQPGETVVVPSAAGAVGAVAGQLAKAHGCRVVGIAGGSEKCRHVVEDLGFDLCLDRHEPELATRLERACPEGVDVYLELVGGDVLWAVLPLLNLHARIPVIGGIAWYNLPALPEGPDRTPLLMRRILIRRLQLTGFLVWDFQHLEPRFRTEVAAMLRDGRLRYREHIVDGLEQAPRALSDLLEGRHIGKFLVRVAA